MSAPTLMYIGAHDVDFLVRAGGTLAKYRKRGSRVVAVSLTFGERQESERLWRETPDITLEAVKEKRRAESLACAALIDCELKLLDWDDCPIVFDRARILALAGLIQEIQPDILITHWPDEETNLDHLNTARAVQQATQVASAAGTSVETGLGQWADVALYYSEPTFPFPDTNRFRPNVWIDITSEFDLKLECLREAWSHGRLDLSYPLCAQFRAYQAQLYSGNPEIKYAEAYAHQAHWVGQELPFPLR